MGGAVRAVVSEELDGAQVFESSKGKYLLATDPLDGSSNIDVNVSVGTIFSILTAPPPDVKVTAEHFLQPGHQQVAAGYVLYGPQTTLVFAVKGGTVNSFTLDSDVGEFILTARNMSVKPTTSEFAINASRQRHWEAPVQRYVNECVAGKDGPVGRDFNMRWVGSMVADVHRILHRGGVFLYPGDAQLYARGQTGKLRLLYEVNPMAFLMAHSGGLATTGRVAVLDLLPTQIHDKSSIILGSREEVEKIIAYHAEHDKTAALHETVAAVKTAPADSALCGYVRSLAVLR